ncbi:MAG: sigma 54-interacting transcriptional regulator [Desulfobacterales bacterium]
MKTKARLNSEERNFFILITKAILSNPFLDERDEILIQIIPGFTKEIKSRMIELELIATTLNERIDRLERKGLYQIQHFKEEDRQLLRDAFLLQTYRLFVKDFDKLIQNQLSLGRTPADVPFAEQIISQLKSRGFLVQECLHYLAMFYQFRRAFYFIDKALVGDSPSMKKLRLDLWNNVFTSDARSYDRLLWNRMEDFSTILLGETGTGKGSAAAAIGRSGFIPFDRKKGQFTHNFTETFIAINLSQYPESLIESELFGHRRGSFTGAVDDHKGLFERCTTNGSLFLDEIGDITIPVQIKLLQVLQERIFTPVGSHSHKRFEGRVIAATNRSIDELRSQGNFRDDFFYRLCSDVITVPSLRQRITDLASELEQMVNLLVIRITGQESSKLTDMILETLKRDLPKDYTWPGNVRELEQAVRRILLTRHYYGDVMIIKPNLEDEFIQKIHAGTLKAKELLSQYCSYLYQQFGTYEEVARRTGLDRRTVKKYLQEDFE